MLKWKGNKHGENLRKKEKERALRKRYEP